MKAFPLLPLFVLSCFLWGSIASAQKIQAVEIKGTKNISKTLIQNIILSKKNTPFNIERWNQDLKRLYSFGFIDQLQFSYQLKEEKVLLQIEIVENPLILEVLFQGNQNFSSQLLHSMLSLRKGTYFSNYEGQKSKAALLKFYQEQGFWFAQIKFSFQQKEEGISLTFHIVEKNQAFVETVEIEGMKSFKAKDVFPYLLTPPKSQHWKKEVLSKTKLEMDRLALVYFYRSKGYLDVKVYPAFLKHTPQKNRITPIFKLVEGSPYYIEAIHLKGNTYLSENQLREQLSLTPGTIFQSKKLMENLRKIYQHYKKSPFPHFLVEPELVFQMAPKENKVQIVFHFVEGKDTKKISEK